MKTTSFTSQAKVKRWIKRGDVLGTEKFLTTY